MSFHGAGWFRMIYSDTTTENPNLSWPLIRRVLNYAQPYRREITILLVTILISALLGVVNPVILREIIDNALPQEDLQLLGMLAFGLMIVPLVNAAVLVYQRWLNVQIGEGLIYDLRTSLFDHLQSMSFRFFTNTRVGELMSRLNNDVVGAQRAINTTLVSMITNTITIMVTVALMLALEWRLTLLGLMVLPLFILPARRAARTLRRIARRQMEENAKMNALMNETLNISGIMLVKLFGRTHEESKRFNTRAGAVRDTGIQQTVASSTFFAFLGLIGAVGTVLVYYFGGRMVIEGEFTIGTIVAFAALLTQLYGPLQALVNAPVEFASAMTSFERVFEVMDLPVEIQEKPDSKYLETVQGEIRFENVTFNYDARMSSLTEVARARSMDNVKKVLSDSAEEEKTQKESKKSVRGQNGKGDTLSQEIDTQETPDHQARTLALKDVNFSIQPGQLAALVGPSGAGKTTITYLIPRLYDPTEGRITLDGNDLRDLKLSSLSEHIGMVTQETYLFHDTLRMNLLYARPDATQEQIEAACTAANIHDYIAGLPEGYDTVVGERGYRLSGGEKQRIAIARVLLKDPKILVLDEATSHLDSQSEKLIQAALEKVMQNRTSIVIAHRLSTILAADIILVMDRGEVVEQGTHDELLALNGKYAELYHTQFSGESIPV